MKKPVLTQEQAEFVFEFFSNLIDKHVKATVKTDAWFAVIFEDKSIYVSADCAHERHDSLDKFSEFYSKQFGLLTAAPESTIDRMVREANDRLNKQLQDSVDEAISRVRFGFIVCEQNLMLRSLLDEWNPEDETNYELMLRLRIKAKQTNDKTLALALKLKMNEVYFGKFPHQDPRLYGHLDPRLYGHPVLDYGVRTEQEARREAIDLYGFMLDRKIEEPAPAVSFWTSIKRLFTK